MNPGKSGIPGKSGNVFSASYGEQGRGYVSNPPLSASFFQSFTGNPAFRRAIPVTASENPIYNEAC